MINTIIILSPNSYLTTNYIDEQQEQHTSVVQQRANVKLSNSAFKVVQRFYPLNGFRINFLLRQDCVTVQAKNCFAGVNVH